MAIPISRIRFWCVRHQKPITTMHTERIFSPTYGTVEEAEHRSEVNALEIRMDKDGWLYLDTSELHCQDCSDDIEKADRNNEDAPSDVMEWEVQADSEPAPDKIDWLHKF